MKAIKEIKTEGGWIRGKACDNGYAFLGIPYAAPPVGELRWRHPQPVIPWEGVRECFEFGSPCCQAAGQMVPGGNPEDKGMNIEGSEDCLTINVWTPDLNVEKLPVMVWIHGGAYCCGSGAGKAGQPGTFLKHGIIYVTFNYRLGVLGFFAHPELSAENKHHVSGNYAHYDQLAAVRWVKRNIAAFGGDPENITVGGCSAGSGSTQVLTASPLADGLFAKAINMSGLGMNASSYPEKDILRTMKETEARGEEFMNLLGCKNIAEMRALPYEELIHLPESQFRRKYHYGTTMGTCADGYLLYEDFKEANEKLAVMNIPRLIGNTNDEGGGFIIHLGKAVFVENSRKIFGDSLEEYLKLCLPEEDSPIVSAARRTHIQLAGAKVFAEMSALAGRAPVYVYDFMRKSPEKGIAHHGLDTSYLVGVQDQIPGSTEDDDKTAAIQQEYWCNFIRTGNPNGEGLPEWTPYTAENRKLAYIDVNTRVLPDEEAKDECLTFARKYLERKLGVNC